MLTVTESGTQSVLQSGLHVGGVVLIPLARSFVEYCTAICIPPVANCGRSGNAGVEALVESVSHVTTFWPVGSAKQCVAAY
jgi:hypothetical protein